MPRGKCRGFAPLFVITCAKKKTVLMFAGVLALACWSDALWADVYKCEVHGNIVYSSTKCADNAQVLSNASPARTGDEHAQLTLYLNASRAFTTEGYVNDTPVTFVVDTGASTTTISQRIADSAGIKTCFSSGYVATANGVIQKCSVKIPKLSFGRFHLRDVTVDILPSLPIGGLLGMNVLRNMKISQQEGVMSISN